MANGNSGKENNGNSSDGLSNPDIARILDEDERRQRGQQVEEIELLDRINDSIQAANIKMQIDSAYIVKNKHILDGDWTQENQEATTKRNLELEIARKQLEELNEKKKEESTDEKVNSYIVNETLTQVANNVQEIINGATQDTFGSDSSIVNGATQNGFELDSSIVNGATQDTFNQDTNIVNGATQNDFELDSSIVNGATQDSFNQDTNIVNGATQDTFNQDTNIVNGATQNSFELDSSIVNGATQDSYKLDSSIVNGAIEGSFDQNTGIVSDYALNQLPSNPTYTLTQNSSLDPSYTLTHNSSPEIVLAEANVGYREQEAAYLNNQVSAYEAFGAQTGYIGTETIASTTYQTDAYEGLSTVRDIVAVKSWLTNRFSRNNTRNQFLRNDYYAQDAADQKALNEFFSQNSTNDVSNITDKLNISQNFTQNFANGFDQNKGYMGYNRIDDGTHKFVSKGAIDNALNDAEAQIINMFKEQGINLKNVKISEIGATINSGAWTFGAFKGMQVSEIQMQGLRQLKKIETLNRQDKRDSAVSNNGKLTARQHLLAPSRGSDVMSGMKMAASGRRALGKAVGGIGKGSTGIINATAKFGNNTANRITNFRMNRATDPRMKAAMARNMKLRNDRHVARSQRRATFANRIGKVGDFIGANGFQKARMTVSFIGKRSFGGAFGRDANGKAINLKTFVHNRVHGLRPIAAIDNLKNRYGQFKLNRRERFASRHPKLTNLRNGLGKLFQGFNTLKSMVRKAAMYVIGGLLIFVLIMTLISSIIATIAEAVPFAGEELANTNYSNNRQETMDKALGKMIKAEDYLLGTNTDPNNMYAGEITKVTVNYPSGCSYKGKNQYIYTGDEVDTLTSNAKGLYTIKDLDKIPFTYNANDPEKAVDGYVGQSMYPESSLSFDDNGEVVTNVSDMNTSSLTPLSKNDVTSSTVHTDTYITTQGGRSTFYLNDWSGNKTYSDGGNIVVMGEDALFKALSSIAISACDVTYDDEGNFYSKYYNLLANMVLENSYAELIVTTGATRGMYYTYTHTYEEDQYEGDVVVAYAGDTVQLETTAPSLAAKVKVKIYMSANVEDIMEMADHYDPYQHSFTDSNGNPWTREHCISEWQRWFAEFGSDISNYKNGRLYNGFYTSYSDTFGYDSETKTWRNKSKTFNSSYENMTDEGNYSKSLWTDLSIDDWKDAGWFFISGFEVDGSEAGTLAARLDDQAIENILNKISASYEAEYGTPLPENRRTFLKGGLQEVGRHYYGFGGGHGDSLANIVDGSPLDCSGYVSYALYKAGYIGTTAMSTYDLNNWSNSSSREKIKPGDILVKVDSDNDIEGVTWSSHVRIYLGTYDGLEHSLECTNHDGVSGVQIISRGSDKSWMYKASAGSEGTVGKNSYYDSVRNPFGN